MVAIQLWVWAAAFTGGRVGPTPRLGASRAATRMVDVTSAAVAAKGFELPFAHAFDSPEAQETLAQLAMHAADTAIDWAVPAIIVLSSTLFIGFGRKGGDDPDEFITKLLGGRKAEPSELLKIEDLSSKVESFEYSFKRVQGSKADAQRSRQAYELGRELAAVGPLDDAQLTKLRRLQSKFKSDSAALARKVGTTLPEMRLAALKEGVAQHASGEEESEEAAERAADDDDDDEKGGSGLFGSLLGAFSGLGASSDVELAKQEALELCADAIDLEAAYIADVARVLTPKQRSKFGQILGGGSKADGMAGARSRGSRSRPSWVDGSLDALAPAYAAEGRRALVAGGDAHAGAGSRAAAPPASVYVLTFDGDVQASQVGGLREELTAVLMDAHAGDEVLLKLNTGGGTVTGYGLAASQLQRVKDAGLILTICVEEVAASGGYMMACCASPGRLFASPFAVLGSIGVISEQPNVYRRLRKEGISFLTVTAGKFKRTLTPFKKPNRRDFEKQREDIAQVLELFKSYVKLNRPQLDIESVATGETWFGPDALKINLVDALITSDDVIMQHYRTEGTRVFTVSYSPKGPRGRLTALLDGDDGAAAQPARGRGLLGALASRLARAVASELSIAAADEFGALLPGSARDGRTLSRTAYAEQILAKSEGNQPELR